MENLYKKLNQITSRLVFKTEIPPSDQSTEKSPAQRRAETTSEIVEEAKENRQAIQEQQLTGETLDTEKNENQLLKEDTYILIGQRGSGSKHNTTGWKGLALATDSVKILSPNITMIKSNEGKEAKEYVKVQLKHKLYDKNGKNRFRTYTGYIEKSKFKDSPEVQKLRREAEAVRDAVKKELEDVEAFNEREQAETIGNFRNKISAMARKEKLATSEVGYPGSKAFSMNIVEPEADHRTGKGVVVSIGVSSIRGHHEYQVNGQHTLNQRDALRLAENFINLRKPTAKAAKPAEVEPKPSIRGEIRGEHTEVRSDRRNPADQIEQPYEKTKLEAAQQEIQQYLLKPEFGGLAFRISPTKDGFAVMSAKDKVTTIFYNKQFNQYIVGSESTSDPDKAIERAKVQIDEYTEKFRKRLEN